MKKMFLKTATPGTESSPVDNDSKKNTNNPKKTKKRTLTDPSVGVSAGNDIGVQPRKNTKVVKRVKIGSSSKPQDQELDMVSCPGSEIAGGENIVKDPVVREPPMCEGTSDNTGGYYSVDKPDTSGNERENDDNGDANDDDNEDDDDLSARCDAEAKFGGVIKDREKRLTRLSRLNKQMQKLQTKIHNETGASCIAFTAPMEKDCRRKGTMYTITSPNVNREGLFVDDNLRQELVNALQRLRPSYIPNQGLGRMRVFNKMDDPVAATTVNVNMEMLEMVRRIGNQCGTILYRVKKNREGVTADSRNATAETRKRNPE